MKNEILKLIKTGNPQIEKNVFFSICEKRVFINLWNAFSQSMKNPKYQIEKNTFFSIVGHKCHQTKSFKATLKYNNQHIYIIALEETGLWGFWLGQSLRRAIHHIIACRLRNHTGCFGAPPAKCPGGCSSSAICWTYGGLPRRTSQWKSPPIPTIEKRTDYIGFCGPWCCT